MKHIPVLLTEVIRYLDIKPDLNYIDATFGFGGHGFEILKHSSPNGMLIGIEKDPQVVELAKKSRKFDLYKSRLFIINAGFSELRGVVEEVSENFAKRVRWSGIIFDLGMSSWHIEKSQRGFSFKKDEPLDMRFNPGLKGPSAADLINNLSQHNLKEIFDKYSQERISGCLSRLIVKTRRVSPIKTTFQLNRLIFKCLTGENRRIHPATRIFQALRITVNHELDSLRSALQQSIDAISPKGRIVAISYHSLEDRIVKEIFRDFEAKERATIVAPKPIVPEAAEVKKNKRARSAKLRCLEVIS